MSKEKKRQYKKLIFPLAAILVTAALAIAVAFVPYTALLPALKLPAREEGRVRLHFLDIGEGDCCILEFSEGDVLVIDGGDGSFRAKNKLVRYLKALRPTSLSLLLTHADVDHYGGFPILLKQFAVEKCYLPALSAENAAYGRFLRAVEEEGCEMETLSRYLTVARENAYLVCISPRSEEESDDRNDCSAVLYLKSGGGSALLCGDIGTSREELLLREYALQDGIFDSGEQTVDLRKIDILKAAHHGSGSSSSLSFLQLTRPSNFILTCGRGNGYRHPDASPMEHYRQACPDGNLFRTDERGDLICTFWENGCTVAAREDLI